MWLELTIRPLIDDDYETILANGGLIGDGSLQKDFLPQDGRGGYMVLDGEIRMRGLFIPLIQELLGLIG